MIVHAATPGSNVSEASNWAEDEAMYSSDSQLSDWEQEEDSSEGDLTHADPADLDLADALQLADHAITGVNVQPLAYRLLTRVPHA